MIDYRDLGIRIRKARLERGMTQEQLAEACGVGTSHISHIETGAAYISMSVFITIVNALDCSCDEMLCKEIRAAKPILNSWLSEQVADCSEEEVKIISDMVLSLKSSLRRHSVKE